ncbi:MAG: hypothetical protein RX318_00945 [bacterium]|nr:hypothetical protein [bacterium]
MKLEDFFEKEEVYLEKVKEFSTFSVLIPLIDQIYHRSFRLKPIDESGLLIEQLLFLSHKCFLSASSLIGRGRPEDTSAITRRALEIAEFVLALNYDPENLARWISKERVDRWKARKRKVKPAPIKPNYKFPKGHQALEELRSFRGVYSDIGAHFSPEYFALQEWLKDENRVCLNYFTLNAWYLEVSVVTLADTHYLILKIFDECMNGALKDDEEWKRLHDNLFDRKGQLGNQLMEKRNWKNS